MLWDYTRLPRPLLYADGIFVGNDVQPPKPITDERRPDPRVFITLGLDPARAVMEPLAKQGSGRKYSRIRCGDQTWVWCAYNPDRRENAGFAAISDFLDRLGIHVPAIKLHLADTFEIVSRDLGQSDLQIAPQQLRENFLLQVVDQIARLHVLGDQAVRLEELPLQKGFTKGLYDWERDYFRNNMLDAYLHAPELWSEAAHDYCQIRSVLLRQPLVPIHRDLQSANVKVKDGEAYLIDFRHAPGCAAYDLGSLLYDPTNACRGTSAWQPGRNTAAKSANWEASRRENLFCTRRLASVFCKPRSLWKTLGQGRPEVVSSIHHSRFPDAGGSSH